MTRQPYQGWDVDPLTVPDDPPPALREPARAAVFTGWRAVAIVLGLLLAVALFGAAVAWWLL